MTRVPLLLNELIRLKIHSGESAHSCVSRLLGWEGEDLRVTWPSLGGSPVAVQPKETVRILFDRGGMAYTFEGVVLEAAHLPEPMLTLRPTSPVERIERRIDVRVAAAVPVELNVKVVSLEEFRSSGEGATHIDTRTVTLSGGGFTIHNSDPLPVGKLFEVRMFLGDRRRALTMSARIVRCEMTASAPESEPFEVAFAFSRIAESTRTNIVRFAFRIQKEAAAQATLDPPQT